MHPAENAKESLSVSHRIALCLSLWGAIGPSWTYKGDRQASQSKKMLGDMLVRLVNALILRD